MKKQKQLWATPVGRGYDSGGFKEVQKTHKIRGASEHKHESRESV